jgi:hypothetical protein
MLVPEGANGIFLCGDVAQTVLPKQRSVVEAGLANITRERIRRNYRNSREILAAASVENLDVILLQGTPSVLSELDPNVQATNSLSLTGTQFLYTSDALGLSPDAQESRPSR